jgi:hypothetical protein
LTKENTSTCSKWFSTRFQKELNKQETNDVNTAEEIYDRIKNAIIKTYGKGYSDKMNILGVYTL